MQNLDSQIWKSQKSPPSWCCIILAFHHFSYKALSAGQLPRKMHSKSILSTNGVCVSCWKSNGTTIHHVRNDNVRRARAMTPLGHCPFQAWHLFIFSHIAHLPDETDAKNTLTASSLENWRRPPGRLTPRGWRLSSRTWNHLTSPWTKQSLGSESPTLEIDVYIWRYALVPRTRTTISRRDFAVSSPATWNSLPSNCGLHHCLLRPLQKKLKNYHLFGC